MNLFIVLMSRVKVIITTDKSSLCALKIVQVYLNLFWKIKRIEYKFIFTRQRFSINSIIKHQLRRQPQDIYKIKGETLKIKLFSVYMQDKLLPTQGRIKFVQLKMQVLFCLFLFQDFHFDSSDMSWIFCIISGPKTVFFWAPTVKWVRQS